MKKSIVYFLWFIFIVYAYSCQTPQTSNIDEKEKLIHQEKIIQVNAKVLKSDVFYKEILSNGILVPCKKAKLVFKVNENITNVNVKNGQRIKEGQILVQLENYNQTLSLEKAKNQLSKAEIDLQDILFAHSPNVTDTAKISPLVLKTARSRSGYNTAVFLVKEAEYGLAHTTLKAPFDGVISDIQVKENNYSGNYEFFAYVLENSQMELEFGVMESELEMISLNAKVLVAPYAFPGKKFQGKISEINPSIDESGMIKVKAIIPNVAGVLLDGMNAEVAVQKEIPNQIVVPKEVVLLRQEREMLFTLKNDSIAQWVYVKTGFENTNQYTITEGVSKGDTIIISNNFNLGHEVIVNAQLVE